MPRILLLAANPSDTAWLRLGEETRAIEHALRLSRYGDSFEIAQHWAVRSSDLQGYFLRYQPDIVHFSGHGWSSGEIIVMDRTGQKSYPISVQALSNLFSILGGKTRCVLLNACYSDIQARSIAQHVDCVIGMSHSIQDQSAISFAAAFYQALGYGQSVQLAFESGCNELKLENLPGSDTPKIMASNSDVVFRLERSPKSSKASSATMPEACFALSNSLRDSTQAYVESESVDVPSNRGISRAEKVLSYIQRLSQEREGPGLGLTDGEWKVLTIAIWSREMIQMGLEEVARKWIKMETDCPIISSLLSLTREQIKDLPSVDMRGIEQFRLRLLGALLILAEHLDVNEVSIREAYPNMPFKFDDYLRKYLPKPVIHKGEIRLKFIVPDATYAPYLKFWFAGPVRRVFDLISRILTEEGWYFWMRPSIIKVSSAPEPISPSQRRKLMSDDVLRSVLYPLTGTLGGAEPDVNRPKLNPAPLSNLRRPPHILSWRSFSLPEGAYYEVRIINRENNLSTKFKQLSSPSIDVSGLPWEYGGHYRWIVYRRWGGHRRNLASGTFQILNRVAFARLKDMEKNISTKETSAIHSVLRTHGLYEELIALLLQEIEQPASAEDDLFASRRDLALLYEQLAAEAKEQQLQDYADIYNSLAASQYKLLRRHFEEEE